MDIVTATNNIYMYTKLTKWLHKFDVISCKLNKKQVRFQILIRINDERLIYLPVQFSLTLSQSHTQLQRQSVDLTDSLDKMGGGQSTPSSAAIYKHNPALSHHLIVSNLSPALLGYSAQYLTHLSVGVWLLSGETLLQTKRFTGYRWDLNPGSCR